MSITVDAIDAAKVTRDVQTLLQDAPVVGGAGVKVERSAPEPVESPTAGWVAIYLVSQTMPIITVGAGQAGRTHSIDLVLSCKQSDMTSGAECTDRLGELVKNVVDALLNDSSFGGNVDFITEARIQYADYQRDEARYTQTAFLFLTGTKRI